MPDALALSSPTLRLYGVIGDAMDGLDSKAVATAVDALDGAAELHLHINSPGGYVYEGLAIYNRLAQFAGRKIVTIDGIAASMASAIAMVGDTVRMPANALMMIHNPWNIVGGDAEDLRKEADTLDKVKVSLIKIYARKTDLAESRLAKMMDAETWLTAQEAKALRFIDEIVDEAPQANLRAVNLSILRNVPQQIAAMCGHNPAAAAVNTGALNMPDTTASAAVTAEPAANIPVTRARQIRKAVNAVRLPPEFADEMIDAGLSTEQASARILERLSSDSDAPGINPYNRVSVGTSYDDPAFKVAAFSDALYSRMTGKPVQGAGEDLRGMSLIDMGRNLLEARGVQARHLSPRKVYNAITHSRSDFPALLEETGNRILRDAYNAAPSPIKQLSRKRTATDFRAINVLALSEAPRLLEVPEGAEITHGTRAETKESFRLKTYARRFSLTLQAIINDDLSAFQDFASAFGTAAASTEAQLFVELLTANSGDGAALSDGAALYGTGSNRANKLIGADYAPGVTGLDGVALALRRQTGIDRITPINAEIRHVLTPPEFEGTFKVLAAAIQPANVADVNRFAGTFQVHVEPRLTGQRWRAFADPASLPVFHHAYLDDTNGPTVEMQEGWEVLGMEWRAVLHFGCGVQDFRGTVMAGAS